MFVTFQVGYAGVVVCHFGIHRTGGGSVGIGVHGTTGGQGHSHGIVGRGGQRGFEGGGDRVGAAGGDAAGGGASLVAVLGGVASESGWQDADGAPFGGYAHVGRQHCLAGRARQNLGTGEVVVIGHNQLGVVEGGGSQVGVVGGGAEGVALAGVEVVTGAVGRLHH